MAAIGLAETPVTCLLTPRRPYYAASCVALLFRNEDECPQQSILLDLDRRFSAVWTRQSASAWQCGTGSLCLDNAGWISTSPDGGKSRRRLEARATPTLISTLVHTSSFQKDGPHRGTDVKAVTGLSEGEGGKETRGDARRCEEKKGDSRKREEKTH
jgi:hypothetical protein